MRDMTASRNQPLTLTAVLRAILIVDAVVFLSAALFNLGVKIPLGRTEIGFPVAIWQAGVAESIIGLALLAAGVTGSLALSWVSFWMSAFGIAFGLSSPAVQGPPREVHILLVPLAALVFGLLVWQAQQSRRLRAEAIASGRLVSQPERPVPWRPISIAICGLMALTALTFAVASVIHFGVVIALGPVTIDDPFGGAAIPEAIIAAALAVGSAALIVRRSSAWPPALGVTLFALLLTAFGLTVTLGTARIGDIIYHVAILAVLAVITLLLLLPPGRRSLGG